jgi:hypothetical protein
MPRPTHPHDPPLHVCIACVQSVHDPPVAPQAVSAVPGWHAFVESQHPVAHDPGPQPLPPPSSAVGALQIVIGSPARGPHVSPLMKHSVDVEHNWTAGPPGTGWHGPARQMVVIVLTAQQTWPLAQAAAFVHWTPPPLLLALPLDQVPSPGVRPEPLPLGELARDEEPVTPLPDRDAPPSAEPASPASARNLPPQPSTNRARAARRSLVRLTTRQAYAATRGRARDRLRASGSRWLAALSTPGSKSGTAMALW